MNKTYVIDAMNVCWWYSQAHPKEVSIQPLLTVLVALLENGDDFYCVFDASITHSMGDNGKEAEAASIENMLKDHPERFYRVIGATRADGVILHDANHQNRSIITNDTYRDYKEKYPWLSDKYTDRLVQGNLQPSGLMTLEKLPYGQLSLRYDTEFMLKRLYELLAVRKAPEVSELDKQLRQRQQSLAEIDEHLQEKETQYRLLITQIGDLERQKEELRNQTAERVSLRKEIDELTSQLNETRASLKVLYGIRDFDSVEKEMQEKLSKLKSDITCLENDYREKKQRYANLDLEAKQYQAVITQKKEAEEAYQRELSNERACIKKAQLAISKFLEPYRSWPIDRDFDGSSWDIAVKKLEIFFDKTRICTHCYEISPFDEGRKCSRCNKGILTSNPKDIWKIILDCAPK
ncbi:hypothetical protein IVG45_03845 [Methylomonas sp. LL1]|uniref:NYN domain-containing protein n=1 Tax=Methylomonas sp. LL1 TaxID=2785785 RepID=UPI0018C44EB5|nr:hypothetical protein [Methylomonas sp. LL1]QPK64115.1 hypothetical protein IVG45_03845 [Methylomonas sp. LL1]